VSLVAIALLLLTVPFVLPIALWVALYRTRTRLAMLEEALKEQGDLLNRVSGQLASASARSAAARPRRSRCASGQLNVRAATAETKPAAARPLGETPRPPVVSRPPAMPPVEVPSPPRIEVPLPPRVEAPPPRVEASLPRMEAPSAPAAGTPDPLILPPLSSRTIPPPPPAVEPPEPSEPSDPPAPSFDWESLAGARLFPAISGIAIVLAAIFFLRYSAQQGWLQPPVRVLIGIAVAIALLVVCELKAARRYATLANALDAAAIAILFATFFSAHALWNLIPAAMAFVLLAAVTAIAVLLSLRRESLFIAVLGLLGGFATPALLSTGENRPVPLFAYLVLLNVGLAWVAYKQVWPVLSMLTLILTTVYQWGWVYRFLTASQLPTALGIFAVFPVLAVAALMFGRRGFLRDGTTEQAFEQMTVVSAGLPLLFVAYLAAVPAYGSNPALLFGFLLLLDAGLLAITIGMGRMWLHALGGLATVLIWAVWLSGSYVDAARPLAIGFVTLFVAFYLLAPTVAVRLDRTLAGPAQQAAYAGPASLFVFAVIAFGYPPDSSPWPLFAPLLALVAFCAWRAISLEQGGLFFTASLLAVAAEAVWSAEHLTAGHLRVAVSIYLLFGVVTSVVPPLARRIGRPLSPPEGGGMVLLASLGLLLFLSAGSIAPSALWALALLLAILNAGLFIESAGARLPALSQVGSLLSWAILALWWYRTAAVVGVLPSLAVVTGLTLVTLAGHTWAHISLAAVGGAAPPAQRSGSQLGLLGHAFLFFVAVNPQWSLPPWPLFASLAVATFAVSLASTATADRLLHVLGVGAAALVVTGWAAAGGWAPTALATSVVISIYALGWIAVAARSGAAEYAKRGAATALFISELTTLFVGGPPQGLASAGAGTAPFPLLLTVHVANVVTLLALTMHARWALVATGALAVSWAAVAQWQSLHSAEWPQLLALAGVLYALFTANALIAAPQQRDRREPWMVALGAAAMAFVAGREAFVTAGLQWMIGAVPVLLGAVTAVLLRSLLRLEASGERDTTRLVLVAGTALALITVAIPLQLDQQWVTIGWALEGAALAWLYQRVPHRGLLAAAAGLLIVVFVRLGLNPSIWTYEPRGALRVFNWYLYTYVVAAGSMFAAAWFLAPTDDRPLPWLPRASRLLPALATMLFFLLLNIEIADYYATGPTISFRFGVRVSQDLTYTIGWLAFGMILLGAGIYLHNRPARVAAVSLIAVTTFKCFLYDLASLGGLHRVASFVGLAIALALVSLVLQKYVLAKPGAAS
jgi:hypothetical protein